MKKILTLSIALILVAGLISLAKTTDIGTNVSVSQATDYAEDRNVVQSGDGTIFTTRYEGDAISNQWTPSEESGYVTLYSFYAIYRIRIIWPI